MRREFQLAAITPPVLPDPALAIAASRAGCIGVLDLEYSCDEAPAYQAMSRLVALGGERRGIKLSGSNEDFTSSILSSLPDGISFIILTWGGESFIGDAMRRFRRPGLRFLVETTCLQQAQAAAREGADGVIAKGHEAGGTVGEETSFVLLQRLLQELKCPVWAHGGIGVHTAAACYAAGAAGALLDAQLWLARECTLPARVKESIARMDGSETVCVGREAGQPVRVYTRPGHPGVEELRALSLALAGKETGETAGPWRRAVRSRAGWGSDGDIWLLGQDAAFAKPLCERFKTTAGILQGISASIEEHIRNADQCRPLAEGSPLAQSHSTRYPIVQGPMTRVSDIPTFAESISAAGALPFLALALMRPAEITSLLDQTAAALGEQPWGVGILGFVPPEIREGQLAAIRTRRPRFALIAGGRPDQAQELEKDGISTYLHVPSPALLKMFLENGARRFVFEGRECGGHVGPRSSFVLWEQMIETLLEATGPNDAAGEYHVLFAGGIHDARSAAMVSALSATLAARGCRIGALLGTAYLFTAEAVQTGAVLPGYQREAMGCDGTVLLETGPGHETRCARTPYAAFFEQEKRNLLGSKLSGEEIRRKLELSNIGRLRIASKGITHSSNGDQSAGREFISLSEDEQRNEGIYMIGQVAALRNQVCTMEELHRDVSVESGEWLRRAAALASTDSAPTASPGLAIIGMSCLFPKAGNVAQYWENILNKVDAIREVPQDRWDWRQYFDADPQAADRVYSKWGGFLDDVPFDPLRYGLPPSSLSSIEPLQLLTLEAVRAALEDSGYLDRPFARDRASVILGVGGGVADLGHQYAVRAALPGYLKEVTPAMLSGLPEWTEDSFPGILQNVAAGRVANRFDLGGVNFTVDAACASSLAAVHVAAQELESGNSDMVIVGAADTVQSPLAYLCFSKTRALSPRGKCRTFDDGADGIVLSEGLAVIVLKRLADAERDGDRIYAVIRGVAGSSDGRGRSLTAPRPEGQMTALRRAYAKAGISPGSVTLMEAHGTGTVAGDQAEIEAVTHVLKEAGAARKRCAIGSVKSMIGHTKCAAGLAGLIKVAMALHHRVLPPTAAVETPNRKAGFDDSPLYINSEPRPWLKGVSDEPRRAGVSSFGFGGTNFHVVLEEYDRHFLDSDLSAPREEWPSELFLFGGNSPAEIVDAAQAMSGALDEGAHPACRDLANAIWERYRDCGRGPQFSTLAIVAASLEDLRQKLAQAAGELKKPEPRIENPRGIYYSPKPLAAQGKIAFLYPGQGSQYPDMLRDLAVQFSEVRDSFDLADRTLKTAIPEGVSSYVFPPPRFREEEEQAARGALMRTDIAQPALGAAELGLSALLRSFGVRPELAAGHSYGEYVALWSAGVLGDEALLHLSERRGRFIREEAGASAGTMAAIEADRDSVRAALDGRGGVWIANVNSPAQTVISGTIAGIEDAIQLFTAKGVRAVPLPVACAFHSAMVGPARDRLAGVLHEAEFRVPQFDVFSNTSAAAYPKDPQTIAAILADHLVKPVEFAAEIESMYRSGARIFVEAGPNNVLTGLVSQVLAGRPHRATTLDTPGRSSLLQLQHALAQLAAEGVAVDLARLFTGRRVRHLRLESLVSDTREKPLPKTMWLVNGGRARPVGDSAAPRSTRPPAVEVPARNASDVRVALTPATAEPKTAAPASITHNGRAMAANASEVMLQYQRLMNRFLETQQSVMLAYLKGSNGTHNGDSAAHPVETDAVTRHVRRADANGFEPKPEAEARPEKPPMPEVRQEANGDGNTPTEESVTRNLIEIVSDRTGYPADMLDLDLNLEADLGINSIKKVEILGAFQRQCRQTEANLLKGAMDRLTRLKTLREVAGALVSAMKSESPERAGIPEAAPSPAPAAPCVAAIQQDSDANPRYRRVLVEARSPARSKITPPAGAVLITDDGRGVAPLVARRLREAGTETVLVGLQSGPRAAESLAVDFAGADSIAALVREARAVAGGPIRGLIHLLPLRVVQEAGSLAPAVWRERLDVEVRSLFLLARELSADLAQASGSWFLAASALGGDFGLGVAANDAFPGHGAIAGLVKCLAKEWPDVFCRVVDVDPAQSPETLADWLLEEAAIRDAETEVGRRADGRRHLETSPAPIPERPNRIELNSDSVLLITGGARGITAAIATELARRYRPTLYLAGRSPFPVADEPARTAAVTAPRLRSLLIEDSRDRGEALQPANIEAALGRILNEREMRASRRNMEDAGARVHYEQLDVRDSTAVAALLDRIYRTHGRLDGVIHGAGIIEDSLIGDKEAASWDRVFDTKVLGALALVGSLRPESLRFLAFFSSVAGLFGNRGQADYGAANEALNKLALSLDRTWAARVTAINWGPWAEVGMVKPEVQRTFVERGVDLVTPAAGQRMFDLELRGGCKGEAEVILGSGPWAYAPKPAVRDPGGKDLPLLKDLDSSRGPSGAVDLTYALDLDQHFYLADHLLDARPVMPAAVALELMAEVVQRAWPDLEVAGAKDFRVLSGVVVTNDSMSLRISARPDPTDSGRRILVQIQDPSEAGRFYQTAILLADRLEQPRYEATSLEGLNAFPLTVPEAYERLLFHGPALQGIEKIHGISSDRISATLLPSVPSRLLKGADAGRWLIDPVVLDSGFQLALLWSRLNADMTVLPVRFARFHRHHAWMGSRIECHFFARPIDGDQTFEATIRFVDESGRLLWLVEGVEFGGANSLNRLSGHAMRGHA